MHEDHDANAGHHQPETNTETCWIDRNKLLEDLSGLVSVDCTHLETYEIKDLFQKLERTRQTAPDATQEQQTPVSQIKIKLMGYAHH